MESYLSVLFDVPQEKHLGWIHFVSTYTYECLHYCMDAELAMKQRAHTCFLQFMGQNAKRISDQPNKMLEIHWSSLKNALMPINFH